MLPLHLASDAAAPTETTERVVVLDRAEQTFVFRQVDSSPVPSLLRGFSAPVILECDVAPADLALLLRHDVDGFNRWEAGQQLAARAFDNLRDGAGTSALDAWCDALAALFGETALDAALLADLLTPPGEIELSERERLVDPSRVHVLRLQLQERLARRIGGETLRQRYEALAAHTNRDLDAASQAQRRLKRRVLDLLALIDANAAQKLATLQYDDAPSMTDRLAALAVLVRGDAPQSGAALVHFRQRYADNPLAMDKWFSVQTQLPGDRVLDRVRQLDADAAFTLKNPNRVNALFGAWARNNPDGFHRPDGSGYRLLAERLVQLDTINPQVAARLATAFNGWQRLEPTRHAVAKAAIDSLAGQPGLSRNLTEIVRSMLHD
jgi:aminopeptidase N